MALGDFFIPLDHAEGSPKEAGLGILLWFCVQFSEESPLRYLRMLWVSPALAPLTPSLGTSALLG